MRPKKFGISLIKLKRSIVKKLKTLFMCVMVLFICGCDNSEQEVAKPQKQEVEKKGNVIKIASLNWAPYTGENLKDYGIVTKKVKKIFSKMDYEIEISFMAWKRVLYEVEQGNYDVGCPAYYSEERAKKYIMSDKIMDTPLVFIKNKTSKIEYNKLEDLKDYKIGVVRGYVNTKEFDNASYLNKFEGSSDIQNLRLLASKRLDIVVIDKIVAKNLISENNEFKNKFIFIEKPLDNKPLHLLFSRKNKNNLELVENFNKILKEFNNAK